MSLDSTGFALGRNEKEGAVDPVELRSYEPGPGMYSLAGTDALVPMVNLGEETLLTAT